MDLELDADQLELQAHARSLLEEACPPALVRAVFDGAENGAALWKRLVELEWPAIAAPSHVGGLAMGPVAEAVLAGELGRAVAPVPYLSTVTQFAPLLAEAGAVELWRQVSAGSCTGALALGEVGGYRPEAIAAVATFAEGAWWLTGAKPAVVDAATATHLAVVARLVGTTATSGLGAFLVRPDGQTCTVEPAASIDPTTLIADVRLTRARVAPVDVLLDPRDPASGPAIERVRHHATVMAATACVGTCRALFERTLAYARERRQFDRPIGQFQAIKHRLADLYLAVERAESLCWYAVACLQEADAATALAAAMAKAAAGECRRAVTRDGLQLHGAIGYTWEHDLHLWVKRAIAAAALFGDVEAQRAELAALLGLMPGPRSVEAAL
jgi:alkylation response protein AidB-like acyl-CoA dehydrogenase